MKTERRMLFAILLLVLMPVAAQAQEISQNFETWKSRYPGIQLHGLPFYRSSGVDDEAKPFGALYGTVLATGATPLESAWSHLAEVSPFLGEGWGELEPNVGEDGEVLIPVQSINGNSFVTFRFNQVYQGLPVFRAGVGFLVRSADNNPLVMSGFTIRDLEGFDTGGVAGGKPRVTRGMIANVHRLMGVGEERGLKSVMRRKAPAILETSDEQLVIYAGGEESRAAPEVAVQFVAERGSIQTLPDYHKYLVVASVATGKILHAETMVHNVDITGLVAGRATTGLATLECNPEVQVGLPYAEATVIGGNTVFADENGQFTIPHGGSTAVTVRSRLRGQWFEVFDEADNGDTPEITQIVTPPGPANFLHNPAPSQEFATANVNAYLESNVVRDYVLAYQPTFPVIGNQTFFDINTNINSSCNAFYNGSSINFYRNGGGCNNTSFSDVVYHEYGHHLVNVTGNGQGQFGEGSGDVAGVLIQDDPILGQGFQGNCSAGIRSAVNSLQYPCTGGIHFCGQVISGAVWDTRNELAVTEPTSYRDINATLYFGMMMVRGQMVPGNQTIDPLITEIYLQLDDDDDNIGNGTPHYDEIATGFGLHNLDAPELDLLEFQYPNGRPDLIPNDGSTVAFQVEVVGLLASPQPGSGVLHVDAGSGFQTYPMNQVSPNVYEAVFPALPCATSVRYYVSALATSGGDQSDPSGAPGAYHTGIAGASIDVVFADDFESSNGWTVSGNASDGQWQRGTPAGGGDRGDPPTDGDGSGQCFVTDNADGNSDVDGGTTTLTSPILDATAAGGTPVVRYWRWYSNTEGDNPNDDIMEIEVSNDGGSNWVNLETVGPSGVQADGGWYESSFVISDVIAPTSQMRFRVHVSDLGSGSIVEAGFDGFELMSVSCESATTFESVKLADGVLSGGALANMNDSDDSYVELVSFPTSNPVKQLIDMSIQSTSPTLTPTEFTIRVESKMLGGPSGDVLQTIQLLNYQTLQLVTVDTRAVTTTDGVAEISVLGDLSAFVQPTSGEITARVVWESPGFSGAPFSWSVELDEAVWIID